MILRAIEIVFLVLFIRKLSICVRDVSAAKIESHKVNVTTEFPIIGSQELEGFKVYNVGVLMASHLGEKLIDSYLKIIILNLNNHCN